MTTSSSNPVSLLRNSPSPLSCDEIIKKRKAGTSRSTGHSFPPVGMLSLGFTCVCPQGSPPAPGRAQAKASIELTVQEEKLCWCLPSAYSATSERRHGAARCGMVRSVLPASGAECRRLTLNALASFSISQLSLGLLHRLPQASSFSIFSGSWNMLRIVQNTEILRIIQICSQLDNPSDVEDIFKGVPISHSPEPGGQGSEPVPDRSSTANSSQKYPSGQLLPLPPPSRLPRLAASTHDCASSLDTVDRSVVVPGSGGSSQVP